MPAFELQPVSLPSGSFAAAWFDDEQCLWNDSRLRKPQSLRAFWNTPSLQLYRPQLGPTAVLYNPHAFAISEGMRDELSEFSELEFLPVEIKGHGLFYILHVVASLELPAGSRAHIPGAPGYNIVNIQAFPSSFEPSEAFFRIRQPALSAAGRTDSCVLSTFANARGAHAIRSLASAYISSFQVASA